MTGRRNVYRQEEGICSGKKKEVFRMEECVFVQYSGSGITVWHSKIVQHDVAKRGVPGTCGLAKWRVAKLTFVSSPVGLTGKRNVVLAGGMMWPGRKKECTLAGKYEGGMFTGRLKFCVRFK
jgi:hypothetical protein